MISHANIGIGLYGNEGMSAVQASDYALPEFKALWRLMFIHGRWNYMRIAELIKYFFFKNMVFTIPQFLYSFYCNFSGASIYTGLYLSLFNTIFTCVPVVVRAVVEQDVNYIHYVGEEDLNNILENVSDTSSMKSSSMH
jgi:phospholipid-transporting ATPase